MQHHHFVQRHRKHCQRGFNIQDTMEGVQIKPTINNSTEIYIYIFSKAGFLITIECQRKEFHSSAQGATKYFFGLPFTYLTGYCGMRSYPLDLAFVQMESTSDKLKIYLNSDCVTLELYTFLEGFPESFCSFFATRFFIFNIVIKSFPIYLYRNTCD